MKFSFSQALFVVVGIFDALSVPVIGEEADVKYEHEGVEHSETMDVEGNTLTVEAAQDGFRAIFDYDRNILLVQNTVARHCFFGHADDVEDMGIEDLESIKALYFEEVSPEYELTEGDSYYFDQSYPIPHDNVALAVGDEMASICSDSASYWYEPTADQRVRRRTRRRAARRVVKVVVRRRRR